MAARRDVEGGRHDCPPIRVFPLWRANDVASFCSRDASVSRLSNLGEAAGAWARSQTGQVPLRSLSQQSRAPPLREREGARLGRCGLGPWTSNTSPIL